MSVNCAGRSALKGIIKKICDGDKLKKMANENVNEIHIILQNVVEEHKHLQEKNMLIKVMIGIDHYLITRSNLTIYAISKIIKWYNKVVPNL